MPSEASKKSAVFITDNYKISGGSPGGSTKSQVNVQWTNTRVTATNPNWRAQVRAGRNATTPFFASIFDLHPIPVSAFIITNDKAKNGGVPQFYYINQRRFGPTPDNPAGYNTSNLDRLARQSFVSQYRNARTAFQTGVFFGELLETVRTIKSPAKALRDSLNDYVTDVRHGLKRRNRGKPRNKFIQESWLEYAYGVAPLVSDVKSACKLATLDPSRAFQVIHSESGTDWKSDFARASNTPTVIGGPMNWTEVVWLENTASIRYGGAARAENSPPGFPEQLGLSWSNVLPTVWELIPYSFLVDYFSNVGKVVDGISTGRIFLAWGYRTLRCVSKGMVDTFINTERVTANYASSNWSGYATGKGESATYKSIQRSSINSVDVGLSDLTFKLPGSGTQWLNIGALASLRGYDVNLT
ncbi:maturation protein [ssRNA phage Zoerhiza.4_15]|uniref:Maturation protein n=2 Tax=Norzivirales TaxID=2842247 RepID=A0A8S5KYU8_9VIRU|nr:maturation protein [ssRNA phage Zoerhiza.4_15]QDH88861.1 MAG: hypothetical protein H4Rhizo44284_000001 [Leviviridae sp.]DAD50042.1 TPA_asm: maturation protein [ssRNA phage Zoerhiza.4_15]